MPLTPGDILLRLGAACVCGFLFGLDREFRGRAAGLRTTILVCLAAAVAMILGELFYHEGYAASAGGWRPDPARLAAGIITGMGFIGAGVILRQGMLVRGVTTAAVLWINTVLGLCFGGGYFLLGTCGAALSLGTLLLLPRLERRIERDWDASLSVTVALDGTSLGDLKETLRAAGAAVRNTALEHDTAAGLRTVRFELRVPRSQVQVLPAQIVDRLAALAGVQRVEWK